MQLNQRRPFDPRRSNRHPCASHWIEHPSCHQRDDAVSALNLYIVAVGVITDLANTNLTAKIRMPAVTNFQLLSDMGRMNGQLLIRRKPSFLISLAMLLC